MCKFSFSVVVLSLCIWSLVGAVEDVSLNNHFQALALKHMPTLFHQLGTVYFPVHVCFDGDYLASNNRACYDRQKGRWNRPWVYIHILHDHHRRKTYIQYWFYYVYNVFPFDNHNDDWELLVVVLGENERPMEVWFGSHGGFEKSLWRFVEKTITSNDHPTAFVDRGSHAMHAHAPFLWGGGKFTTWEELVSERNYTFLGSKGRSDRGVSILKGSGYDIRNNKIVYASGNVTLPSVYEQPDDSPFANVMAPWRRIIWTSPEQRGY